MLAQFEKTKYLYIRSGDHRFIPIWVVVVDGRVVVRSWEVATVGADLSTTAEATEIASGGSF